MNDVTIRLARMSDLGEIVTLLADDPLGAARESDKRSLQAYKDAFNEIDADPGNMVLVAEDAGAVIGCVQVTFIANLSFQGGRRALIEGVRVTGSQKGKGLGRMLIQHVIAMAKERGCKIVQLTCNTQRPEALQFYEQIGFQPTHVGFKMYL